MRSRLPLVYNVKMRLRLNKEEGYVLRSALGTLEHNGDDTWMDIRYDKILYAAFKKLGKMCGYRNGRRLNVASLLKKLEGEK